MEENKHCYDFQKISFDDGFFENSVDATYIIHLKGNGRYEDIQQQLRTYHPTNTVYLVMNQGYKTCKKQLPRDKPAHDLTDAFLQIFKHSNENNYQHILILEDDFAFRDIIKESHVCGDINDFLNRKKNDKLVYYLGCIPYIQTIGYSNHNVLWLSGGTHACIYSKGLREHIIKKHKPTDIIDWDIFNNMNTFEYSRYIYYQPLCYQLWTVTENSQEWYNPFGAADMVKYIVRTFKLDVQVEPGHTFFYVLSKMMFLFICLFLFVTIWNLIRQLYYPPSPILRKMARKIPIIGLYFG